MRLIATVFASLCIGAASCAAAPPATPRFVLDGVMAEWTQDTLAIADPRDAAEGSPLDLRDVHIAHDASFIHLSIQLGRVVNVQQLGGHLWLVFNCDGNARTGSELMGLPGADFAVVFSPRDAANPNRPPMGVGLVSTTYTPDPKNSQARRISAYDAGVIFAPTYASSQIEMRLDRGGELANSPPLFTGGTFTMRAVVTDLDDNVLDETKTFTYKLGRKLAERAIEQPVDPLARAAGSIRVVSWNAEFGGIFSKSDVFGRVLRAIDPDVVLLQELGEKNSASELEQFFNSQLNGQSDDRPWHVAFGEGGGNLRCGVASRFEMDELSSLAVLSYADQPKRTLRSLGSIVNAPGGRLLVNSIHLKCCGGIDTREDTTRIEEARIINRAVRDALAAESIDGVVIAGDFNLVGSSTPLKIVIDGADRDASDLAIADPMQLDGGSNTTWSAAGQPFVPGRLDFVVYSDSTLKLAGAFVFDSRDLAERWLKTHDVQASDTAAATDHFPVVADLLWGEK